MVVYVATDGDDAADGTTYASAVRTPARALAILGASRGAIQLLPPSSSAPALFDPGPNGIVIAYEGQLLLGDGFGTQIDGSKVTSGGAVVTMGRSRTIARDFTVATVPANKVGVRVTQLTGSNEDTHLEDLLVNANGVNAIAYGIGDDTTYDVSETLIKGCTSGGNLTTSLHMIVGNGGTGNVLDAVNIGGNSQCHAYGIVMNGGAIVSHGLSFQQSCMADIWFKASSLGANIIRGGRSEGSKRFCVNTFATLATSIALVADYSVFALQNTDGEGVQSSSGPITFDNVSMTGLTCPQFWSTVGRYIDGPTLNTMVLRECASEHPHPLRSPFSRPGKHVWATGMRFTSDFSQQMVTRPQPLCNVRRQNVTTTAAFSLDPIAFDTIEARLSSNAGAFTLSPGAVGQRISITFEQDGIGGYTYTWPVNVAFDGGSPPAWVGTRRNRQTVSFEWTGSYWAQCGSAVNMVPPVPVAAPITETFAIGYPFSLLPPWGHLPGGGSLGVSGGVCVAPCVGPIGDIQSSDNGMFGPGAGAVVETGISNATIVATFVWRNAETIIAHYLDEQTFVPISLCNVNGNGGVYISMYLRGTTSAYGFIPLGALLVSGTTYTLSVTCTSTGFIFALDGGAAHPITWSPTLISQYGDLTKHGFILSSTTARCSAFSVA